MSDQAVIKSNKEIIDGQNSLSFNDPYQGLAGCQSPIYIGKGHNLNDQDDKRSRTETDQQKSRNSNEASD